MNQTLPRLRHPFLQKVVSSEPKHYIIHRCIVYSLEVSGCNLSAPLYQPMVLCLFTSHHTLTCLHPLGSSEDGWNHCPPGIAVIMQTVCCSQCVCAWSAGAQPAHAQCTALQHASYQCVMYNMLVAAPWGMTPARGEGFLLHSM